MMNQVTHAETTDSAWKGLYRVGGAAALIAVVVFRRNLGSELVGFRGFGIIDVPATHPSSAIDWFTLLQNDRFVGLSLLNVFDIVNYALLPIISAPFRVIWYILIGQRLFQLGSGDLREKALQTAKRR